MANSTLRLAVSATLHCLTGCAIGEVSGMVIGTALDFSKGSTIALAVVLAFLFGYALSLRPLLRHKMSLATAAKLVLAADTLSIAVMELVDNLIMATIPGAMEAGLASWLFWGSLTLSLAIAFMAAVPVNYWLMSRGKGHALMHQHHHH